MTPLKNLIILPPPDGVGSLQKLQEMGLQDWEVVELSIIAKDRIEYSVWWSEHRGKCGVCFSMNAEGEFTQYCVHGAAVDLLHNGEPLARMRVRG